MTILYILISVLVFALVFVFGQSQKQWDNVENEDKILTFILFITISFLWPITVPIWLMFVLMEACISIPLHKEDREDD